jgi:23S rRNA (pseudouridine1915-N3)-methyltransferase
LSAVARADRRIVLDEHGKSLTSEDFASFVQDARDNGARDMVFLIGGPDGHDPRVREQANLVLSMSHMTLPHGLARALLVEQLYRALTIISGHPYHRA